MHVCVCRELCECLWVARRELCECLWVADGVSATRYEVVEEQEMRCHVCDTTGMCTDDMRGLCVCMCQERGLCVCMCHDDMRCHLHV